MYFHCKIRKWFNLYYKQKMENDYDQASPVNMIDSSVNKLQSRQQIIEVPTFEKVKPQLRADLQALRNKQKSWLEEIPENKHYQEQSYNCDCDCDCNCSKEDLQNICRNICISKGFNILFIILLSIFFVSCLMWDPEINEQLSNIFQIIQLTCHCLFTLMFIIKAIQWKHQRVFWLLLDISTSVAGIIGYSLYATQNGDVGRYFKAYRAFKLIFLIKQIQIFYQPANKLMTALASIGNILIPAFVLLYIYAVVGLYSFSDLQYSKCRDPANLQLAQNWTVYSQEIYLCGQRSCPIVSNTQYQCLNPIDYNVEPNPYELVNIDQGYGLMNYQNIFFAILSTVKQIFITGSSRLIILYKQVVNEIYVQIYYYSFVYLKSYIYLNIFYSLIILAIWGGQDTDEEVEKTKVTASEKKLIGSQDQDIKAIENATDKYGAKVSNSYLQTCEVQDMQDIPKIEQLNLKQKKATEVFKRQSQQISPNHKFKKAGEYSSRSPEQAFEQKSRQIKFKNNEPSYSKNTLSSKNKAEEQLKVKVQTSINTKTKQNVQVFKIAENNSRGEQEIVSPNFLSPRGEKVVDGGLVMNNARIFNVFQQVDHKDLYEEVNCTTNSIDKIQINSETSLDVASPQLFRVYEPINNIIILLCCINLSLDYNNQDKQFKYIVDCIDFAFYMLYCLEIIFKITWERVVLRRVHIYTFIDAFIFLICTAGVFYEAATASGVEDFLSGSGQVEGVLRAFKYLRIVLLIFRSTFFTEARLILESAFRSLYQIKHVVGLWMLVVFIFSIIGFHLHSYKTKIDQNGQFSSSGQSFQLSYDGMFNSIIFTMLTFYNEEWDYLMFQQYLGGGVLVVISQLISISVGLLLFSKYFMASFMVTLDELITESYDNQNQEKLEELLENKSDKEDDDISQIQTDINNSQRINDINVLNRRKISRQSTNMMNQKNMRQKGITSSQSEQPSLIKKIPNLCRRAVQHLVYKVIFMLIIMSSCLVLISVHPHVDRASTQILPYLIIDKICKAYFMLDLLLNLIGYGICHKQHSYFHRSYLNWINIVIIIIQIISFTVLSENYIFLKIEKIKVLRVLYVVERQYKNDWNMRMTVLSFMKLLPKVLTLLTVTIVMYSFFALILVKCYKNYFYSCANNYASTGLDIKTKLDCLNWGGDWIQMSMNTANLFNSTLFLFLVATTEGWIMLMQPMMNFVGEGYEPILDTNKYISIFFVCFFFFGNLIMLNVFVGLSVSNFKSLKQILTGEANLSKKEKTWLLTKTQIYKLEPVTLREKPKNCLRGFAYVIASTFGFKIAQGIVFISFLIVMSLYHSNMSTQYRLSLQYVQYAYIGILFLEYIIQLLAFGIRSDYKRELIFKNIVVFYAISYIIVIETASLETQYVRVMGGISIALQLIRYLSLLDEIPFAKKLLNSLVTVLPQTSNIMLIICVTLFIYAIIGMQFFAFLKPSPELDSFNQNYTKFGSALFALVKFSTMESPINQIIDAAQELNPNFICNQISSYSQYLLYGQTGCGNKALSYIFFISFHIFYSLLLMSTLMAIITDSYSTVRKEQNAKITKFVLYKVQRAWSRFDPQATGYIPYRQFWMFTAQLLEIYTGKDRKETEKSLTELFASKEEFLKSMSISIYQNQEGILCFQFNQVIEALTKVYLRNNWGGLKSKKADKMFKQRQVDNSIGFKKSSFTSSHVATLIVLKSGLKHWKKLSQNEGEVFHYSDAVKNFIKVQQN